MSKTVVYRLACVALLLTGAPIGQANTLSDDQALEAQWRMFHQTASQTRPALVFPHAECFRKAAKTHDLPETLLLAVARGESDFDANARSHANAYGLMQILWPGTAEHLGVKRLSQLLDPCTNVDAGTRYLKELLAKYRGNLHRALAAYNYGPARIPVTDGTLPKGAVWYSGYILRHLGYVLNGSQRDPSQPRQTQYADRSRLFIIRFARPYRADAFVASVQPLFKEIRLDWFRRPEGGFDVVMLYTGERDLNRGRQLLSGMGF